ncbi:peptidyl-prolyl cis-trans isomerase B (cyclophilin B) [Flavobacteriaceae bacterium MAR_2010_188]|nr:peptidyl-prolyl cis-trans isomerase B (cyclophilin B) [Flavobacteriaceae bacterium MAR_2010_188]
MISKKILKIALLILISTNFLAAQTAKITADKNDSTKVEIITNLGKIVVSLSNRTPLHRDNFLKLVRDHKYDSTLLHRVIKNFMIQGGDPDSKNSKTNDTLGSGDVDYKVPAEINKSLFHKKGALAAARDGNAERASSGMQFYIVQGKIFNDSLLVAAEIRINGWLGEYYATKDPKNKKWIDSVNSALDREDYKTFERLRDTITSLAEKAQFEKYKIPQQHREIYKTTGGAPHLDQNYTVFGEVIEGIDVVDAIAASETGEFDRPKQDVIIISTRILED